MNEIVIPLGYRTLILRHLVLDVNEHLPGRAPLPGVDDRIAQLREHVQIQLVSGDTFGTAAHAAHALGLPLSTLGPTHQGAQKLDIVRRLGADAVAVAGNGSNDALALAEVALGICVIGPEGAGADAVRSADVVVGSIEVALDLLLVPQRLIATLRR